MAIPKFILDKFSPTDRVQLAQFSNTLGFMPQLKFNACPKSAANAIQDPQILTLSTDVFPLPLNWEQNGLDPDLNSGYTKDYPIELRSSFTTISTDNRTSQWHCTFSIRHVPESGVAAPLLVFNQSGPSVPIISPGSQILHKELNIRDSYMIGSIQAESNNLGGQTIYIPYPRIRYRFVGLGAYPTYERILPEIQIRHYQDDTREQQPINLACDPFPWTWNRNIAAE